MSDLCKKERTVLRQQFTNLRKKIVEGLTDGDYEESTAANVELLSKKVDRLLLLDRAILDTLLEHEDDEVKIQEEMDGADKYQNQWLELTSKIARIKEGSIKTDQESIHTCQLRGDSKKTYKLPRLDLTKFDGDVRNWLQFWGQFQKIHTDAELNDHDKFQYLLSAVPKGTEARDLIDSFPPSAANYHKAIDHLKQRYGREELLIEVYVRELLTLIISQVRGQYQLSLTSLYDKLTTQLRALESMGLTSDKYACMLYPMVESALPAEVLKAWERYHTNHIMKNSQGNELDQILTFLKHEVESNQRILLARNTLLDFTDMPSSSSAVPTASCLVVGNNKANNKSDKPCSNKDKCVWCNKENHTSMQCYKALELSLDSRKEHLKKAKACFVCLRVGHSMFHCKSRFKCLICLKRHNALVCPDIKAETSKENKQDKDNTQHKETNELLISNRHNVTLLQTLLVKISYMGRSVIVRALIDSGAQRSYLKRNIIKQLGLIPIHTEQMSHVVFGGTKTKSETHKVYKLTLTNLEGTTEFHMTALDEDKICGDIPRIHESQLIENLNKHNILLTDVGHDIPEVELLIGADYCGLMFTSNIVQLENGLTALQTKLGWTIQGTTFTTNSTKTSNVLHVTELWDLETIGIKDSATTKLREEEENEVLASFKEKITVNEEGRYEVRLPFKEHYTELMSNKELAEKRLISSTKRLVFTNNFHRYLQKLREYLRQRFKKEYLSMLIHKGKDGNHKLNEGDVVLIEAESKRVNWPLGLVIELCKGSDGQCRVAKLKTETGQRMRPLQKLYPLEVSEQLSDQETRTRSGRIVKIPDRLQI